MRAMKPCVGCEDLVDADVHEEELGMCVMCSNAYFSHDHDECSWGCMLNFWEGRKKNG